MNNYNLKNGGAACKYIEDIAVRHSPVFLILVIRSRIDVTALQLMEKLPNLLDSYSFNLLREIIKLYGQLGNLYSCFSYSGRYC